MNKFLLSAAVLAIAASGANAADLAGQAQPGYGDVVTNIFDGADPGTIKVAGITVYGAIDLNMTYQNHGVPVGGGFYPGALYQIQKYSQGSQFLLTNNAIQQSFVGIKGEQSLSDLFGNSMFGGWKVIGDAQIGFDPAYADIADVCKTLRQNNGLAFAQTAALDGSRCGQLFNGPAFGGIKNEALGQLTYGRHNSLLLENLAAYDPNAGSYANSIFSFSGTVGGGLGATEDARWNNSLRYSNAFSNTPFGTVRVAGMYRFEGEGQGGNAYSVGGGIDLPGMFSGLSIDGSWSKFNDAQVSGNLSGAQCTTLVGANNLATCQQLNILSGTISNDEAWSVAAKYNLAQFGLNAVTVMGGYEYITKNNPTDPAAAGTSTIGNYVYGFTNNNFYTTEQAIGLYWVGAKWAITPKLLASGAYYHFDQNSWTSGGKDCTTGANPTATIQGNCAGSLSWVGASIDYQWTRRLDVYAGISYTEANGGVAAGIGAPGSGGSNSVISPTVGARFRF